MPTALFHASATCAPLLIYLTYEIANVNVIHPHLIVILDKRDVRCLHGRMNAYIPVKNLSCVRRYELTLHCKIKINEVKM